ncbi:hypothetical protein C8245_16340 [Paracidovorax avenae]|nr:hypothetical protein C8245_16340 [Paracidovorax avenae]
MENAAPKSNTNAHWQDDLMNRGGSATFLQNLIEAAALNPSQKQATCVAIDGDWGTGKSFFIERWSNDLSSQDRCVVTFDAWKNDLSEDPLIGFISEISTALKPWLEKLPRKSTNGELVVERTTTFARNAGRAMGPLVKTIFKHAAAKIISKEATEILEQLVNEEVEHNKKIEVDVSSDAVEAYFEAAVEGHKKQQQSISNLIKELEQIAVDLKAIGYVLPIYIFVDELDRCRPSYALRLLEGIKHVLNAKGICFILATNLSQLSHSVKAVYGESFDGRNYLKRFLDYEYRLPHPNNFSYANFLVEQSLIGSRQQVLTGLAPGLVDSQNSTGDMLARVANMFGLDLRSMRQILLQSDAAAAQIPPERPIHVLYLFCLAAIAKKNSEILKSLLHASHSEIPQLNNLIVNRGKIFYARTYNGRGLQPDPPQLADLLEFYQHAAHLGKREFMERYSDESSTIKSEIYHQIVNDALEDGRLYVQTYPFLIGMAGTFTSNR